VDIASWSRVRSPHKEYGKPKSAKARHHRYEFTREYEKQLVAAIKNTGRRPTKIKMQSSMAPAIQVPRMPDVHPEFNPSRLNPIRCRRLIGRPLKQEDL